MQYARQTQNALDRLDQSLARLRNIVKRGQVNEALQYSIEKVCRITTKLLPFLLCHIVNLK